jgi:hypothetical protein
VYNKADNTFLFNCKVTGRLDGTEQLNVFVPSSPDALALMLNHIGAYTFTMYM